MSYGGVAIDGWRCVEDVRLLLTAVVRRNEGGVVSDSAVVSGVGCRARIARCGGGLLEVDGVLATPRPPCVHRCPPPQATPPMTVHQSHSAPPRPP